MVITATYEIDGWVREENWQLAVNEAKEKALAMLESGMVRYVLLTTGSIPHRNKLLYAKGKSYRRNL